MRNAQSPACKYRGTKVIAEKTNHDRGRQQRQRRREGAPFYINSLHKNKLSTYLCFLIVVYNKS